MRNSRSLSLEEKQTTFSLCQTGVVSLLPGLAAVDALAVLAPVATILPLAHECASHTPPSSSQTAASSDDAPLHVSPATTAVQTFD